MSNVYYYSAFLALVSVCSLLGQSHLAILDSSSSFEEVESQRRRFLNPAEFSPQIVSDTSPIQLMQKVEQYEVTSSQATAYNDLLDTASAAGALQVGEDSFRIHSSMVGYTSLSSMRKLGSNMSTSSVRTRTQGNSLVFYYILIVGLILFLTPFQVYGAPDRFDDKTSLASRYTFLSIVSFPTMLGGFYFLFSSPVPFYIFFLLGFGLLFLGYIIPYVACKLLFNKVLMLLHYVHIAFLSHMVFLLGVVVCVSLYMSSIVLPLSMGWNTFS